MKQETEFKMTNETWNTTPKEIRIKINRDDMEELEMMIEVNLMSNQPLSVQEFTMIRDADKILENIIEVVESRCLHCGLIDIHKFGWAFCPWCGSRKSEIMN